MHYVQVLNSDRGSVLGTQIGVADRWWTRMRGLLGRRPLEPGEGLLLQPCQAVHMYGMSYPLDVAFLDRSGSVVALYPGLSPGRRTSFHRHANKALELPSGTLEASGTQKGDTLICQPPGTAPDERSRAGNGGST